MSLARTLCCTVVGTLLVATELSAGQFVPIRSEVSDPEFREWEQELADEGTVTELAAYLNDSIVLPTDVTITVAECDTANAFYSAQDQAIIICLELIGEFYHGALELGWSEEDAERAAESATAFFFYHELGHALIHVLELPTTGREEDAVDQLSTYALAYESEEGPEQVLTAALAFLAWAQEEADAGLEATYWGEHSLNGQRFFNLLCWVYGQDPERYSHLVREGHLPEDRAERCPKEWEQIDRSWSVLLEPYLEEG